MSFIENKLAIAQPDSINLMILCAIAIVSTLFVRRHTNGGNHLFSHKHTDELKGIAIAMVVVGHLWVHVSETRPLFIFSGNAVSMFLILSGFGLSRSVHNPKFKDFANKRIKRVMTPYWVSTVLILALDHFLLGRHYRLTDIVMTFMGLNFSFALRQLDYVRWFITFILIWYSVYFVLKNKFEERKHQLVSLLLIAFILFVVHYYFLEVGWYQFLSFPTGVAIGLYYDELLRIYKKHQMRIFYLSIAGILYVLAVKLLLANNSQSFIWIKSHVPNIALKLLNEFNSVTICLSVACLYHRFTENGYSSILLSLMGKYSYEIFLLHGCLLIKYNFIMRSPQPMALILEFMLFFAVLIYLSTWFSRLLTIKRKSA